MEKKDAVIFKGTAQGLKMIIDDKTPVMEILEAVREKIKASAGFFKGDCDIYVVGRELNSSDKIRVTSVMQTLYPEAKVIFGDIPHKNHTDFGARFIEDLGRVAESSKEMLKSDRKQKKLIPTKSDMQFYDGSIFDGEELNAAGDILVLGNVEKGAKITASGSIYILGGLFGEASAGSSGDEKAKIAAVKFSPTVISIAGINLNFNENAQENGAEIAHLMNHTIFLNEIL
ncbi:MAG: hypothetical protein J6N52_09080 [Clostridia bacterium]|nr:hypothetical protein [Clostridia bacterium]